jgi:hypothetical protein
MSFLNRPINWKTTTLVLLFVALLGWAAGSGVYSQSVHNMPGPDSPVINIQGGKGNGNGGGSNINVLPCWATTSATTLTNSTQTYISCKTDGALRIAVKDGAGNDRYLAVDANGAIAVTNTPTVATSGGTTPCAFQSAASTNATNCKASAGQIYSIDAVNTTSTIYYLRLYNLSTSPTCSSATGFIRSIPIPHGTGAGGGIVFTNPLGEAYGTGIAYCFTGGGSSTDNTNAATGVYVNIDYK